MAYIPDYKQERIDLLRDMIFCLKIFGVDRIGSLDSGSIVLRPKYPHCGIWLLTDNGGEYTVGLINSKEPCFSVPYDTGILIDGGTAAYRVSRVIKGEAIDYKARFDDVLDFAKSE